MNEFVDYSYTLRWGTKCVICERFSWLDLCQKHYEQYKDNIAEPWLRFLRTNMQMERRRGKRDNFYVVSLDHIMDAFEKRPTLGKI